MGDTRKEDSVIQRAVESQDATLAVQALEEIARLLDDKSTTGEERHYLLFTRASCYTMLGDFTNARHALTLALQDRPDSADTRATFDYMQGLVLQTEGKYREAFQQFSTCLGPEWQDVREDIQIRRAFLAVTLKRFEEAIPLLELSVSLNTNRKELGDTFTALGLCYLERKDFSTAKDHFIKAMKEGLSEYASSIHFYLGIAYYYCGMLRESKREFLRCEAESQSNGVPLLDVYTWLSSICKLLEEPAESDEYARLSKPS